ncbi:hypothetical protein PPS11_01894 [Pseudomonas putida S11]|nr:hypothetical protein PPS11_01894 [Pseudomonas putida S11]
MAPNFSLPIGVSCLAIETFSGCAVLNRGRDVVFETLAYGRQIRNTWNTELGQMFSITDTGEHQQVRRVDGTSGQDDLATHVHHFRIAVANEVNLSRALTDELDSGNLCAVADMQVFAITVRVNVGLRRAPTDAFMDVPLSDVNTLLAVTVMVFYMWVPCLDARLKECLVKWVVGCTGLNVHRAVVATVVICALVKGFCLAEVRQAILVAPTFQAHGFPVVVIPWVTAYPVHTIDRRRPAEHSSACFINGTPVELCFRLGMHVPVEFVIHQREAQGCWHLDVNALIGRPRLKHQHRAVCFLGKPARQHATGRAGSDHDIVVGFEGVTAVNITHVAHLNRYEMARFL